LADTIGKSRLRLGFVELQIGVEDCTLSPQTQSICAIFSWSVMRFSRSSTRAGMGAEASL